MKTSIITFAFLILGSIFATGQDQERLAYSYISSNFEKAIFEQLDKSKLTGKSLKLYEKSMKKLNAKTLGFFNKYLSEQLKGEPYQVLPLNTVSSMSNSALNLEGYPLILFPKKTLKKNADKDLSDVFLSATLSISKPIAAVVGMKPEILVTLKLFNKDGELLNKVSVNQKTDKKISNMGFAVNQSQAFDKMDYDHALILFSKVEPKIMSTIEEAVAELSLAN